ncbi:glycosyltransferase family 2 protein [Zunongwangia mangrovi]|nr:glycosyltransferase family 2 protein [Zunongwangia mangrovi]
MSMISVVIPLYNKAHTILKTIQTVLDQTLTEFELIVVNDGSTDEGVEVIEKNINDPRIKIINQDNKGVSVARNTGVRSAKNKYIAFLDGDDEWLPTYLETMADAIKKFPNAGMFCCAGLIRNSTGIHDRIATDYRDKIVQISFFQNPHVFLHTSATIVSKIEFDKLGGFPVGMKRNQDYALFFQLALTSKVIYCGTPLSIYVGDVAGQATQTKIKEVIKHVVGRYNLVHARWLKTGGLNVDYPTFLRYEVRHFYLSFLKKKDYSSIKYFNNNLNIEIKKCFTPFEFNLYRNTRILSYIFIYLTKVRWRLRGYPRLGK